MSPPSSLVITMHDDRGRPPAGPSGHVLNCFGFGGSLAPHGASPGCCARSITSIEWFDRPVAATLAVGPIAVVQHQYSMLDGEAGGGVQWCHERGIPFLAWSPLASGFLADSFDVGTLDADDLRRRMRWATTDAERVARVRDVLGQVAARHEATMVAVALAWTTRRPGVHSIVGAWTPAETEVFATPLPALADDDLRLLDGAAGGPD